MDGDLEKINEYFQTMIWTDEGLLARQYLLSRGIDDNTIKTFRIGWCPDGWRGEGRWRRRIMFPLIGAYGNIEAFSGRLVTFKHMDDTGSYILEAETNRVIKHISPLGDKQEFDLVWYHDGEANGEKFVKKNYLYGLYQAKKQILEKGWVLIVEGQFDAVSMHQGGIHNVVGTLGSAFTEFHACLLHRYSDFNIFMFDGDEPGRKALEKAKAKSLDRYGAIHLPNGSDPSEFFCSYGTKPIIDEIDRILQQKDRSIIDLEKENITQIVNTLNSI